MIRLFSRKKGQEDESPLARLFAACSDKMDSGELVRALARSVVHVPMPGEPAAEGVRIESIAQGDGPPLYCLEDADGVHALVYTTPRRLVEAWGSITLASIEFSTLLLGWPEGVDLVINAGHPEAMVLDVEFLHQTALEVAGVPTATSVQISPAGFDARVPATEPIQILGVTRQVAEQAPEVRALWRAEIVNREPNPRALLTLVVELDLVGEDQLDVIARRFTDAISEADPSPVRLVPVQEGRPPKRQDLVDAVKSVDSPYWRRTD